MLIQETPVKYKGREEVILFKRLLHYAGSEEVITLSRVAELPTWVSYASMKKLWYLYDICILLNIFYKIQLKEPKCQNFHLT